MRIENLTLKNFRGLNDIKINLDGKSTVLFGNNGAGKSSILHSIIIIFSQILDSFSQGRFKSKINIHESDISYNTSRAEIDLDFFLLDKKFSYSRSMDRDKRTHPKAELTSIMEFFKENFIQNTNQGFPIFAHYGVNRSVLDVPLRIRKKHEFDKIMSLDKAFLIGTDFRTFFEWYRNREDYENEIKVSENISFEDIQLQCVRRAIYSFMQGFKNLRVQRSPLVRMVIEKDGKKFEIEQLSDGEKCMLAMIGDLSRRLSLANPDLADPLMGQGIVLIDEIELHLHPEWQRKITGFLIETFPNIQFIISTHSPQVLGETKGINVLKLLKEDNKLKIDTIRTTFGRDSSFILEQFMNTPEKNITVSSKIQELYDYIKSNNFDAAERVIDELRRTVGNDDADVVKATILTARGKAKIETDKKKN